MCQFKTTKGEAMKIGTFVWPWACAPGRNRSCRAHHTFGRGAPPGDQRQDRLSQHLGLRAADPLQRQRPHVRQDEHDRRELLARRRCVRHRQMVGRRRSALPAMVELDGRQEPIATSSRGTAPRCSGCGTTAIPAPPASAAKRSQFNWHRSLIVQEPPPGGSSALLRGM